MDSPDLSLNISGLLQHDRQLKVIATALEKKIKSELLKMQKDDKEKYEKFWHAFGTQLKYGVVADFGAKKDLLQDLLLFWSSKENTYTTLAAIRTGCLKTRSSSITPAARPRRRSPSCPRWSASWTRAMRSCTAPRTWMTL